MRWFVLTQLVIRACTVVPMEADHAVLNISTAFCTIISWCVPSCNIHATHYCWLLAAVCPKDTVWPWILDWLWSFSGILSNLILGPFFILHVGGRQVMLLVTFLRALKITIRPCYWLWESHSSPWLQWDYFGGYKKSTFAFNKVKKGILNILFPFSCVLIVQFLTVYVHLCALTVVLYCACQFSAVFLSHSNFCIPVS